MYAYRDVCWLTKQCASTDLNAHLQRFMYTANKVNIYRFECTLSKMNVHLESLCAFLIQSWLNTCNKAVHTKKDECTLEIECIYWPLTLGISISKFVRNIFHCLMQKSNFYLIWKELIRRIFLLFWNHVYYYRPNCTLLSSWLFMIQSFKATSVKSKEMFSW